MMMAALEGGLTFQKGLGAVHALSHPLGGLKAPSLHHGTLNAVLLPGRAALQRGGRIGEVRMPSPHAWDWPRTADLARFVEDLNESLGLPRSLSELGVPRDIEGEIAVAALADHSTATNPRPVSEAEFRSLFAQAW